MVGADDHEHFVPSDDPATDTGRGSRAFDETPVGSAIADLLGDGLAVRGGQDDLRWLFAAALGAASFIDMAPKADITLFI